MIKSKVSAVIQIITTDLELRHILKDGLSSYYIPSSEKNRVGTHLQSLVRSVFRGIPVFAASLLPLVFKAEAR